MADARCDFVRRALCLIVTYNNRAGVKRRRGAQPRDCGGVNMDRHPFYIGDGAWPLIRSRGRSRHGARFKNSRSFNRCLDRKIPRQRLPAPDNSVPRLPTVINNVGIIGCEPSFVFCCFVFRKHRTGSRNDPYRVTGGSDYIANRTVGRAFVSVADAIIIVRRAWN